MALPDARPADFLVCAFKESSCHMFFIAGSISKATHTTGTRSCRGLAGPFIAVRSASPQYVCNGCTFRTCLTATFVQRLFHSLLKRGAILNAEHNANLHMLSPGPDDAFNPVEVGPADEAVSLALLALRRVLLNTDPSVMLCSAPERPADTGRACLHARAER